MEAVFEFIGIVFQSVGSLGDKTRAAVREGVTFIEDPFLAFYLAALISSSMFWLILKVTIFRYQSYWEFFGNFNWLVFLFTVFIYIAGSYQHSLAKSDMTFVSVAIILYHAYVTLMGAGIKGVIEEFKS